MLTGDKDETAISIGGSCGLIAPHARVLFVNEKTKSRCWQQMTNARHKLQQEGIGYRRRDSRHVIGQIVLYIYIYIYPWISIHAIDRNRTTWVFDINARMSIHPLTNDKLP